MHQVRTAMGFLRFLWQNFMRNQGLENAKALTYTSLFAVVPLLTLTFSILSAFPSFQVFGAQIQEMIYQRLLPSTGSELQSYISSFTSQARNVTWAGVIILLITAYLMLVNIERNFNRIWGVSEQRKGVASFLLYWSVLSLGPLLLGAGFAVSSYFTSLALFETFTELSDLVGARSIALAIFPIVLTTIAFTLLYVAVPNCGVKLRHGFCGALVVSLGFIFVKWIFIRFITMTSYGLLYGTFAAIPTFLLWLYVCWVVILFGANLVRAIPLYGSNAGSEKVHASFVLLALIHKLWEKQQSGEVLKLTELLEEKWPLRSVSADQLISELEKQHLVHAIGDDEYALSRDLTAISFWQVLSMTPWGIPSPDELEKDLPDAIREHLPERAALLAKFSNLHANAAQEFNGSIASWFRQTT